MPSAITDNKGHLFVTLFAFAPAFKTKKYRVTNPDGTTTQHNFRITEYDKKSTCNILH